MDFRDTLSTLIPEPRDDEPASLRQDIIDELGDHLACAFNRELLRGVDSTVARQRALERFGDPATVARRLWFDAMKGKIMVQRVMLATCLVVTLSSLSLVGWVWVQSNRVAAEKSEAEANRRLAEALVHVQATNKEMLRKLSEMSEAIRNPRSPDWNPVKLIVTDDTQDGPPAADWSVNLSLRDGNTTTITRQTNAAGVADFGLVHPGEYIYHLQRWEKEHSLSGSGYVSVGPGTQVVQRIFRPRKAIEPVPVRVRCDWPPDLANEKLVVCAPFAFVSFDRDGESWSLSFGTGSATRSVLSGPGSAASEISDPWGLFFWASSGPSHLRAAVLASNVRSISVPAEPMQWERGKYRLTELTVLRRSGSQVAESRRQEFEVLVRCGPPYAAAESYLSLGTPPTDDEMIARRVISGGVNSQIGMDHLRLSEDSWSTLVQDFDALPDRVNEWTITLPEELVSAVRAALKPKPTAPP